MIGEAEAQARHYKNLAAKLAEENSQMKADLEKLWDMYLNKSSAEKGQAAIKDGLTAELEKLDPLNKMLNSGYRAKLYDEAYDKNMEALKKRDQ